MPSTPQVRRERRAKVAATRAATEPKPTTAKKKCGNCGEDFAPNPKRPQQRFCKDNCRKMFHRHGTAFPALEAKLRQIVAEQLQAKAQEITDLIEQAKEALKEIRKIRSEVKRLLRPTKPRNR